MDELHLFTVEMVEDPDSAWSPFWQPQCPCGWTGNREMIKRAAEIQGAAHRISMRVTVL